jgi:hypothetical protein
MNNIEVIDNFLDKEIFNDVYNKINDGNFPWFKNKNPSTVDKKDLDSRDNFKDMIEYMQFVHIFYSYNSDKNVYEKSNYFHIIEGVCNQLLKKFNREDILIKRAKVNLQPQHLKFDKHNHNSPHVDLKNEEHKVLLLYINDSDGDTFFFDKNSKIIKKVSPVQNRAIIFDGDILHAGSHPKNSDSRIVINIDFD